MEITFPVYKEEDKDHDYHTIDGLSFLTDDVIGECGSDWTVNWCLVDVQVKLRCVCSLLQPPRTSSTTVSTCGAGAEPRPRDAIRRRSRPWFWRSCSGPARTSRTCP